jgi:hypothetical protein
MTQSQALTQALVLAIIAPDDDKASKASTLAMQIAQGLTQTQVNRCKAQALKMIGENP